MQMLPNTVLEGLLLTGEGVGEATNNSGKKQRLELWGKEEGSGGWVRSREITRDGEDEAARRDARLKSWVLSAPTGDPRKSQLSGRDGPVEESPWIRKREAKPRSLARGRCFVNTGDYSYVAKW